MLLTVLESVLRTNLLLEHAQLYRQSTMRPTIRYQVIKCQQNIWETAEPLIRQLPLPPRSRGVIYVQSYVQRESVAEEMNCSFYKATATDKQELLYQWASGRGGWIVAIEALETNIDISKVVYIIHLGRPYSLTSFMQQTERGGRAGEISDSIVILSSNNGSGSGSERFDAPRQELINMYFVEAQDETALTEYLESSSCWRAVLAQYLDGHINQINCLTMDSILCDRCKELSSSDSGSGNDSDSDSLDTSSIEAIHQALQIEVKQDKQLKQFHQLLYTHCIYCQLILSKGEEYSHCHQNCLHVVS